MEKQFSADEILKISKENFTIPQYCTGSIL